MASDRLYEFNGQKGHWYTDEQGNRYFVAQGQTPKEGWEATKRRKMIKGGKYVKDDGDDKGEQEISANEYETYEADEDEQFDVTTDADFEDDKPEDFDRDPLIDPEEEDENERLRRIVDERVRQGWDQKGTHDEQSIKDTGYLGFGSLDALEKATFGDGKGKAAEKNPSAKWKYNENDLDMIGSPTGNELLGEWFEKNGNQVLGDEENEQYVVNEIMQEFGLSKANAIRYYRQKTKGIDRNAEENDLNNDGTNGWKPSEEATTAYDVGGFYSINEGDRWEYDGGGFVEVENVSGDEVTIRTPGGNRETITKDELSERVKRASKVPASGNNPLSDRDGWRGEAGDSSDPMNPENPKYEGFERSDMTNVKQVGESVTVDNFDSGKKETWSIVEYVPYGALKDGTDRKLYGLVTDYDGSDTFNGGAIVATSLEDAKRQLEGQLDLAEQGSERYTKYGKWDEGYFNMMRDKDYDWSDEDRAGVSKRYGWDLSKDWKDQEHVKNAPASKWRNAGKKSPAKALKDWLGNTTDDEGNRIIDKISDEENFEKPITFHMDFENESKKKALDRLNEKLSPYGVTATTSDPRSDKGWGEIVIQADGKNSGGSKTKEADIDERKINHIEEYFNIWGRPSEREFPDVIKHYGLNEKEAAELKKRLRNK